MSGFVVVVVESELAVVVSAITMRHGYGFVQFACEDEAQKALKDGASKFLRGYQLGKL